MAILWRSLLPPAKSPPQLMTTGRPRGRNLHPRMKPPRLR